MKKAEVRDGVVVNIIEIDPSSVPEWCADWPDAEADTGIGHEWNGSSFRRPSVSIDDVAADVRKQRNDLLALHVDPVAGNILRWQDLHPLKQLEVIEYRRSLLNVTDQAGFPLSVEWPTQPVL
jgi:hypothetical protein